MSRPVTTRRTNESRRDFLKSGGALVVSFAVGDVAAAEAAPAPPKSVATDQVDGFLAIDARGRVTVYSGKVDLGTGVQTAMAQIAAEELSVPLDRVTVIQGDTALTPDQGVTFGSLSIQNGGMQIRHTFPLDADYTIRVGGRPANRAHICSRLLRFRPCPIRQPGRFHGTLFLFPRRV